MSTGAVTWESAVGRRKTTFHAENHHARDWLLDFELEFSFQVVDISSNTISPPPTSTTFADSTLPAP